MRRNGDYTHFEVDFPFRVGLIDLFWVWWVSMSVEKDYGWKFMLQLISFSGEIGSVFE